jgi:hypothetical protein
MSLETYLAKGFRLPVIVFYAVPLGLNWVRIFSKQFSDGNHAVSIPRRKSSNCKPCDEVEEHE